MYIQLCHALYNAVVECEVLLAPANGRVGVPSNRFGSVAVYFCDDNFELDGDKSRTCQFNGQWSGTMPFCRRKWRM